MYVPSISRLFLMFDAHISSLSPSPTQHANAAQCRFFRTVNRDPYIKHIPLEHEERLLYSSGRGGLEAGLCFPCQMQISWRHSVYRHAHQGMLFRPSLRLRSRLNLEVGSAWQLPARRLLALARSGSTEFKARAARRYRGKGMLPEILPQLLRRATSLATMRVYVISDLHTDFEANMDWVKRLSPDLYLQDALIVAGDVSEDFQVFKDTMRALKGLFKHVFFVPGNHDLWCRGNGEEQYVDSLSKLGALNDFCESIGVETRPKQVNNIWIVPLLSWYHQSFDKEREIESHTFPPPEKKCKDYSACKWPGTMDSSKDDLALYFDGLNAVNDEFVEEIHASKCPVITFSHFLPRVELCPEKRMLFYPKLLKIVGSDWLEARIRRIHGTCGSSSACHVFGHTHFCWDTTLDGVRYIQAPLAYPKERERRMNGGENWLPLCVYDSETGLVDRPLPCHWSEHYRIHKRDPENIELAPWVVENLRT